MSQNNTLNSLIWATLAAIIANLLCPLRNTPTSGIALHGDGARFVGENVARLAGCGEYILESYEGRRRAEGDSLFQMEERHGWPVLALARGRCFSPSQVLDLVSGTSARNCILEFNWHIFQTLGISLGWHRLECHYPFTSLLEYRDILPKLIPAYLLHLVRQRLALPEEDTLAEAVVEGLAEWWATLGGSHAAVRAALSCLEPDQRGSSRQAASVVECFGNLLCRLSQDGEVYTNRASTKPARAILALRVDGLRVLKTGFQRLLAQRGAVCHDSGQLTQALAEEGILVEETDIGGVTTPDPAWIIAREWWEKKLALWKNRAHHKLRVVG